MSTEVTTALIAAVTAIAVAGIGGFTQWISNRALRVKVGEVKTQVDQVHESTVNTHPTNLRDDVDKLLGKFEELEGLQSKLAALVTDLLREVKKTARFVRDHEAASVMIVEQLEKKDRQLEALIRRYHKEEEKKDD